MVCGSDYCFSSLSASTDVDELLSLSHVQRWIGKAREAAEPPPLQQPNGDGTAIAPNDSGESVRLAEERCVSGDLAAHTHTANYHVQ